MRKKSTEETPNKVGRPKIEIDIDDFRKLCEMQCTKMEIASFFDCSEDTIENFCKREFNENFSVVFNKYASVGKISLRRKQMMLADKNATMAIWLGKQYLGQKDEITVKNIDDDVIAEIESIVLGTDGKEDNEKTGS